MIGSHFLIHRPTSSMQLYLQLYIILCCFIHTFAFYFRENLLWYLQKLHSILANEHSKTMKREFVYNATYLAFKLIHSYNTLIKKYDSICVVQNSFSGTKHFLKQLSLCLFRMYTSVSVEATVFELQILVYCTNKYVYILYWSLVSWRSM